MRSTPLSAGERLGRYEIVQHLATGGMAEIYLARASGIGSFEHHVVLKVIAGDRAHEESFIRMFLDEARVAARLHHTNIARVHEVGQAGGEHFYAMEYVHGVTVRTLLEECAGRSIRIPLEVSLAIIIAAASGLHYAHEQTGPTGAPLGIVHRDVSPSNLMVAHDGAIKVLDFGIVLATDRATETVSGVVKGKYAYMAPEQCRAGDLDRRADVFALGIVLYELVAQVRAFKCESDFETMTKIVNGELAPPREVRPDVPPALDAIVMKALAVDRTRRYQSAAELGDALESYAEAAGMTLSQRVVERFTRQTFGERPEPWRRASTAQLPAVAARSGDERETMTARPPTGSGAGSRPAARPTPATQSYGRGRIPNQPERSPTDTSLAPIIHVTTTSGHPPARWGRRVKIVAPVVVLAGVLGAVWFASGPRPHDSAGERALAAASDAAPGTPVDAGPSALASIDAAPAAPPPTPATVVLSIRSVPAGATVVLGGSSRGVTPLELTVPQQEAELVLELERRGYQRKQVTVSAAADGSYDVTLRRRGGGGARTGSGSTGEPGEVFANPFE